MTAALQVAVVRRLLYPDTDLKRVAYDVATSAAALGVEKRKLYALLHTGQIPSLNTGKQYLLPGATLLDIAGKPLPGINDHREAATFRVDRLYTRANLRVLLGTTVGVVRGLVENQRIEETVAIGAARYVEGSTIVAYLGGSDVPLRESA